MTQPDGRAVIGVRCPTCEVPAGERCRTRTGQATRFHRPRPNMPGFTGRNDEGKQFCLTCQRWKYPAIHSCRVPQRPWIVRLTCCGRDNGEYAAVTWEEADKFREAYLSGAGVAGPGRSPLALMKGHDRSAIIVSGP